MGWTKTRTVVKPSGGATTVERSVTFLSRSTEVSSDSLCAGISIVQKGFGPSPVQTRPPTLEVSAIRAPAAAEASFSLRRRGFCEACPTLPAGEEAARRLEQDGRVTWRPALAWNVSG